MQSTSLGIPFSQKWVTNIQKRNEEVPKII